MDFDTFYPAELPPASQSTLMNGLVVPRPIAWVSTIGSDGVNLAPFSYFNVVAVEPCIVMFSISVPIGPRAGTLKDTLQNLKGTPEFVLHLVDRELAEKMHLTSAELLQGENEFRHSGLTELASTIVRPPRIAEAGVHMECRVFDIISLGGVPFHMVLGEVLALHVRNGIISDRHNVNPSVHQPISRMGAPGLYSAPTDQFMIKHST
jgi:flavin reductase (DIM6/NTAB) family NADH-FMN oxidoreductase RutF